MCKKMLVVIDYQNDFVDGALGFSGARELDALIAAKVREYTERGEVVVATQDTHRSNYLDTREGRALPVEHCIIGTSGWKFFGETGLALTQYFLNNSFGVQPIEKSTFGVSPVDLAWLADQFQVDEIEFAGVVTNMCVLSNACCFQAAYPEAQIIVDANLCAGFEPILAEKSLDVMEGVQVKVINRGGSAAK